MAEYNSLPLVTAAEQFAKLPGIGMKTAQKLAYFILNQPVEDVEYLYLHLTVFIITLLLVVYFKFKK